MIRTIERKDHEVYFIDITDKPGMAGKRLSAFVDDRLQSLHPGYSILSKHDIKRIVTVRHVWLMVTVMDQSKLSEYRYSAPKTKLVTATSLFFSQKSYLSGSFLDNNGERIGYSIDEDAPISEPSYTNNTSTKSSDLQKKIPSRAIVFGETTKKRTALAVFLLCFLVAALVLGYSGSFRQQSQPVKVAVDIPKVVKETVPSAVQVFSDISMCISKTGGKIHHFVYSESSPTVVMIGLSDVDPVKAIAEIQTIPYLQINSISQVEYVKESPRCSISLGLIDSRYKIVRHVGLFDRFEVLRYISALRDESASRGIVSHNETIRSLDSSISTIAASSSSVNFVKGLRIFRDYYSRIGVHVAYLSIQPNVEAGSISWEYSLCKTDDSSTGNYNTSLKDERKVLSVLGFNSIGAEYSTVGMSRIKETDLTELTKVGTIISEDGKAIVYYRDKNGKIVTRKK